MDRANVQRRINAVLDLPYVLLIKLFLAALAIAQIVVGAVYLKDCPLQHYIPVYVLVYGVFTICLVLPCCTSKDRSSRLCYICDALECNMYMLMSTWDTLVSTWKALVSAFMFCWFISGSVWIYSIYPPSYNSTVPGEPYCHKTLYLFAFWTTTMTYVLLAGLLVAGSCVCMCLCVCKAKAQSAVPDSA